jgi:predicted TIM-barrel fold metal-dependent hydrolase
MALAGVEGAVLVPLGPEDTYVSDVLAANPSRFAGIAVAGPGQYDPAQVADRLDRGGFKGLRIFALPGDWDDAPWRGLLERLEQDARVLWLYSRAEDLANVATIAARLDSLRIVLDHCGLTQAGIGLDDKGRPRLDTPIPQPTESAILDLSSFENMFVILSGAYGFSHLRYPDSDIGSIVGRLFALLKNGLNDRSPSWLRLCRFAVILTFVSAIRFATRSRTTSVFFPTGRRRAR